MRQDVSVSYVSPIGLGKNLLHVVFAHFPAETRVAFPHRVLHHLPPQGHRNLCGASLQHPKGQSASVCGAVPTVPPVSETCAQASRLLRDLNISMLELAYMRGTDISSLCIQ